MKSQLDEGTEKTQEDRVKEAKRRAVEKAKHLNYGSPNFRKLAAAVVAKSVSNEWEQAKMEWKVKSMHVAGDTEDNTCVCSKEDLMYLFTIENTVNGNLLFPIGSVCINRFGRSDLNQSVAALTDVQALVQWTPAYIDEVSPKTNFSRKGIDYLHKQGAITLGERNWLMKRFNGRSHKLPRRPRDEVYMLNWLVGKRIRPWWRKQCANGVE